MPQSFRLSGAVAGRLALEMHRHGDHHILHVESPVNEVGLLFRLASVLYVRNWEILSAKITSPGASYAKDEFTLLRPGDPPESELKDLGDDLELLLFKGMAVLEYLTLRSATFTPSTGVPSEVQVGFESSLPFIDLVTKDRRGLFLALTQAFFLTDVNILEASLQTDSFGRVRDRFYVDPADERFQNEAFRLRLAEELRQIL